MWAMLATLSTWAGISFFIAASKARKDRNGIESASAGMPPSFEPLLLDEALLAELLAELPGPLLPPEPPREIDSLLWLGWPPVP